MVIILIGFTAVAAVAVILLMRRGGDKDYLEDRFGFE